MPPIFGAGDWLAVVCIPVVAVDALARAILEAGGGGAATTLRRVNEREVNEAVLQRESNVVGVVRVGVVRECCNMPPCCTCPWVVAVDCFESADKRFGGDRAVTVGAVRLPSTSEVCLVAGRWSPNSCTGPAERARTPWFGAGVACLSTGLCVGAMQTVVIYAGFVSSQ